MNDDQEDEESDQMLDDEDDDDDDDDDDNDYDDGGGGGAATEYEYKENDEDDIYDDESNIKNEDAFNDDDLNKIDDLIDNDLDEENVLFTKRTAGNKRKLNEIDTKVWREHNNNNNNSNKTNKIKEDNDIGSTAKVQKTFIDGMLKLKRNQSASPSNISSTLNSPSLFRLITKFLPIVLIIIGI